MSEINEAETMETATVQPDTVELDSANWPDPAAASVRQPRPRIRFGTIVWGLIVCAVAVTTLAVVADTERRDDFGAWLLGLGGTDWTNLSVLAVGAIVLLLGLLAVVRRAQRRR